jgi:hypothetical protein
MSTVRAYANKKRVATGKSWGKSFLQVYPERKTFSSEGDWMSYILREVVNSVEFKRDTDTDDGYESDEKTRIVANPIVNPSPKKEVKEKPVVNDVNPNSWTVSIRKQKAILPPGQYYIGDLCYSLKNTLYDKVFGPQYDVGYFAGPRSTEVFMIGGHFDDGTYKGNDRKKFEVDSGTIGIASVATLDPQKAPFTGGHMYVFKGPVHVNVSGEMFKFHGEHSSDPKLTIYIYEDADDDDDDDEDYCE